MTDFGDQAVQRFDERVAPYRDINNFTAWLGGGGNADAVTAEARANARRNAESQEATVGATGGSIYSATGHGVMGTPFDINLRDPGGYVDPRGEANRQALADRTAAVNGMQNYQMQAANAAGATSAGTTIDQAKQAQFRNQQLQLGNMLMQQANGQGPSVAGSQLRQSTEQNLQAALAQAASSRGGNLGAAQYALGNARANIQQQAAMGLAQARIQEQMGARAQLGQVLDSGRGADIGLATNQAQLGQQNNQFNAGQAQQNNQFNAGLQQQAGAANLSANVQQEQFKQQTLNQLLAMGMSYDQANAQADTQARQYAADLFNRSQLAVQGINMQGSAQTLQLFGGVTQAAGNAFSGLSSMGGR
jgi:hypothetical protein